MGLHETFAIALRLARESQQLSQAELAERVELSVEAYGRLERGRVLPRANTLVRIAEALRVTTDQLLGRGPSAGGSGDEWESRVRALDASLRDATPGELGALAAIFTELLRWRRQAGGRRRG